MVQKYLKLKQDTGKEARSLEKISDWTIFEIQKNKQKKSQLMGKWFSIFDYNYIWITSSIVKIV